MEAPVFLEFVRLVIDGDRDRVAGMLAAKTFGSNYQKPPSKPCPD